MKLFPCLTSLSAALCAVLIFSCSPDSSDTPTPNEGISSSSKKGSDPSSNSGSPNGSSSSGVKQSSSSGAKPSSANSNGSIECNGYCQWDECVRISTDPTGEYGSVIETCEEAIENCNSYSESHQIFTTSTCKGATKPSSSSADPNASVDCNKYCKWEDECVMISTDPTGKYGAVTTTCEKAIENCEWFSPSQEAYSNLSTCRSNIVTPSSSSSSYVINATKCKNDDGYYLYCEYLTGCFALDPAYADKPKPCTDLARECLNSGFRLLGIPEELVPIFPNGKGTKCEL